MTPETLKARESLHEFIRQAWHVLEPSNPFVDGWHLGCIAEHLQAVTRLEIPKLVISMPPRHMKLCADDTVVPTPDGYRTHGDLTVGDYVFGSDGTPALVTAVSPKAPADYEVTFSNGETVWCNGDHLWTVYDRWKQGWFTLSTLDIAACNVEPGRSRFFIPDEPPLDYEEKYFPLHPYFLGCWLGDGTSTKPAITHAATDTEHLAKLARLGYRVTAAYTASAVTSEFRHQGLATVLRDAGLIGRKHIPIDYLTASDAQRLELLAGLIDTDGHVAANTGRVRISTCDAMLAGQIRRLAVSLGFRATINAAQAPGYGEYAVDRPVYQVAFQPNRPVPTAIPRKRIDGVTRVSRRRAIVCVERSRTPKVGHCITVDRPDGLYLIGDTNIVTHNSLSACVFWFCWVWAREPWTRWLVGSYAENLATRDLVKSRDVIKSQYYQQRFGHAFSLKGDQNTKEKVQNTRQGFRMAVSVKGQGLGEGGEYVIADDPLSVEQSMSATDRETAYRWWTQTMSSRFNSPTNVRKVLIMHRLHEHDPVGRVLADGDGYEYLCLPFEAEPRRILLPDPARKIVSDKEAIPATSLQVARPEWRDTRPDGAVLWPERFPPAAAEEFKRGVKGGQAGQLQQRPNPAKGKVFTADLFRRFYEEWGVDAAGKPELWFVLGEDRPELSARRVKAADCRWGQVIDTAMTVRTMSDYTAIMTFCVTPTHDLLVYHVWRKKLEVREQLPAVYEFRDGLPRWSDETRSFPSPGCANAWPGPILFQGVENKGSGVGLIQQARADGKSLLPLNPGRLDKVARCSSAATMYQNGAILHRARGDDWLDPFEAELLSFPNGANDDMVDCLAYAADQCVTDTILNEWNDGRQLIYDTEVPTGETYRVGGVSVHFDD